MNVVRWNHRLHQITGAMARHPEPSEALLRAWIEELKALVDEMTEKVEELASDETALRSL